MVRGIGYVKRLFKRGNVCVTGLRGTGKDLIFGNVIHSRKKEPYVSNLDYGGKYNEFFYQDVDLGGNTYDTMLSGPLFYEYPFDPGTDIYISDVGCYFPLSIAMSLIKSIHPYRITWLFAARCHIITFISTFKTLFLGQLDGDVNAESALIAGNSRLETISSQA